MDTPSAAGESRDLPDATRLNALKVFQSAGRGFWSPLGVRPHFSDRYP